MAAADTTRATVAARGPRATNRPPPQATLATRGLTLWARVAVGNFYREVRVTGDPTLLQGRPAVIAANHTNALGDVALLLTVLPQFPHFLAASTWWRRAPVRLLFRMGRVLPVARRHDGKSEGQNDATFAACNDALARADHIAIFPEGVLNSGPGLLPFRTGAARIALGATTDAGIVGVVVVPVAIAYEDRGRLGSDVVVHFGAPVEIDAWVDRATQDAAGVARELTDLLQERLADSFVLATTELETGGVPPDREQRHQKAELVLLAPVAAAGLAANAMAIAPIALGTRFVRHEGWQATAKAVGATVLLPLTWIVAGRLLAPRWGARRAVALVAAAAGSGRVSLAWLERRRALVDRGRTDS